ncbi:MAG: benzaldehyde dehydrogenase, partial [Thermoleophilaceae bacterium]|nr:benzaldehyde dehydrogenase [Thermoleophilaceae bacterium]
MSTIDRTATLIDAEAARGKLWGGGWTGADGRLEVREPATGEVLAEVGAASGADVERAAVAAAAAQPEWAATPASERGALMERAADAIDAHADEIATWLVREGGAARAKADFEIGLATGELRAAAKLLGAPMEEQVEDERGRSVNRRLPVGVVGVISPWNFPMILSMRSVAPALALGNAVVLKADEHTPIGGGLAIAMALHEAGLPAGLLHVVPGGADAGQAICTAPAIGMVSFTGSTAVGRQVGATAGRNLKRVALELGGNNAFIVLGDVDPDGAASAGAWGSFLHQGQICMTAGRHIVHESIADAYVEGLVARAERLPMG